MPHIVNEIPISEAVDRLKKELKNDPDYRRSWVDNISMSIQDSFKKDATSKKISGIYPPDLKEIADSSAELFLHILESNHN